MSRWIDQLLDFWVYFAGAVRGSEVESLSKGRHNILTFRRSISMLQNSRILVDLSQFSVQVPWLLEEGASNWLRESTIAHGTRELLIPARDHMGTDGLRLIILTQFWVAVNFYCGLLFLHSLQLRLRCAGHRYQEVIKSIKFAKTVGLSAWALVRVGWVDFGYLIHRWFRWLWLIYLEASNGVPRPIALRFGALRFNIILWSSCAHIIATVAVWVVGWTLQISIRVEGLVDDLGSQTIAVQFFLLVEDMRLC